MNKIQRDILVGCLLGDANLHTNTGQTWRLRMLHSSKQGDYLEHLYTMFKCYCKTGPIKQTFFDNRTQKNYFRVYFNSLYTDQFHFYGQSFYKKTLLLKEKMIDGYSNKLPLVKKIVSPLLVKRVPKNIHRFLTARALAYWYMDDGSLKWKNKSNSVVFCTESFLKQDVLILKSALERNFNLKVSLQRKSLNKEQFRLCVLSESAYTFKILVSPYIHPSMIYKLNEK